MPGRPFYPVCEPLLAGREKEYVHDALDSGWISSAGSYIPRFEEAFASYCHVRYGVSCCNGTAALHLALLALGVGEGDEVILPSFTMMACAAAVCHSGAVPVFVDACPETWNIDPGLIEEKITEKTKAIMVVHLFGLSCEMRPIRVLAQKYNLFIVEDAAEAHGASYWGEKTGSLGDIAAFSFFANKNITTGEGGMVTTNNPELADQVRYYKNLCFPLKGERNYIHRHIGYNYRMTNLTAAIGLAQTEKADEYKEKRQRNGRLYREFLSECPWISFQKDSPDKENVYWMNAVLIEPKILGKERDECRALLKKEGIDTRLLFCGMHAQPALKEYQDGQLYPVSDRLYQAGFYLPSGSGLEEEDIRFITDKVKTLKDF